MRIIYCVLLCVASIPSLAQQNLDIADPSSTGGNYGSINFLDASSLGQKKVENISYEDVRGSAFWNDNWNSALFFLSNNRIAKVQKAKLNLYTDEVHFIGKNGTEFSLENTTVLKVIFFKGMDTTTVLGVFESFQDNLSPTNISYYQVLNNGKFRLLILKKNSVKEGEYDPTAGKWEHSFYSKSGYAIANDQNIIPVKSFDQTGIFEIINASPEQKQWVFQSKYKLKNETQVVSFLNYCNSQIK
jgi:hypothetical protein